MSRTYLYGYSTPPATQRRKTLAELEKLPTWNRIDPELRRRLLAMFDAAADEGVDVGLGGGWRSSDLQLATALKRHIEVKTGGCCSYNGKRYALRAGQSHAAFPDFSYHESSDAEGEAFAADLIGDLPWVHRNCWQFGLIHFADVNNEPWHVQPTELPRSRRKYTGQQLAVWPLPTPPAPLPPPLPPSTTTEYEMHIIVGRIADRTDNHRWVWNGVSVHLLASEQEFWANYGDHSYAMFRHLLHPTQYRTLADPYWMDDATLRSFGAQV